MLASRFKAKREQISYLARYTHRAAIANSRLVAIDEANVTFTFKDYRRNGQRKVMRLDAHEFIRRFLLHVLPDGFHRIRHYGFLANGHRAQKFELCRSLLEGQTPSDGAADLDKATADREPSHQRDITACPACGGVMRRIGDLPRIRSRPFCCDTS